MFKNKLIIFVFLICIAYWIYLAFNSSMLLMFDAIGYVETGRIIAEQGWVEFFKTGPHREPLYPASIAFSLLMEKILSVSYQSVQKIIQISLLFFTQILSLNLLQRLRIHPIIQAMTILYIGFSPALVNATFSLFSEVIALPFVLMALIACIDSWRAVQSGSTGKVIKMATLTAGCFLLVFLAKGIFQHIFMCILIVFLLSIIFSRKVWKNVVIYILVAGILFNAAIAGDKYLNKIYNGQFEVTNRYADLLYGNAHKRSLPLTSRVFRAHLTSIPGGGVCRRFFSDDECRYTEFFAADNFRGLLAGELDGAAGEQRKSKILSMTKDKILAQPFQYVLFTLIEAARMPFWESTSIGFVSYPPAVNQIYSQQWFKDGIRLFMSFVTLAALFYSVIFLLNNYQRFNDGSLEAEQYQIIFFLILVTGAFTGLYALFSIVTRYAIPIAPLYLILIAFMVNSIIFKQVTNETEAKTN